MAKRKDEKNSKWFIRNILKNNWASEVWFSKRSNITNLSASRCEQRQLLSPHWVSDCDMMNWEFTVAVEFLLELSTHLRKLYLGGNYEREVKWVELIIGMLSRKLDTLHVNHWWREILTREDADRLIVVSFALSFLLCYQKTDWCWRIGWRMIYGLKTLQQLPFVGKKVWFKVDFALNTVGRSTKLNGHVIHGLQLRHNFVHKICHFQETCPITRPNKPKKDRALSIIHKSRLNEVSPRGY